MKIYCDNCNKTMLRKSRIKHLDSKSHKGNKDYIYCKTWVITNPNINEIDDIIKHCHRDVVDNNLFAGILNCIYDIEEKGRRGTRTGLLKNLNDSKVVLHNLTIEFYCKLPQIVNNRLCQQ